MKRRENKSGSVYKLSDTKRSKPWVARVTDGYDLDEKNKKYKPIYKYIGRYKTQKEARQALEEYNKNPYSLEGETLKYMYERFIEWYEPSHAKNSMKVRKTAWNKLTPLYDVKLCDFSSKQLQEYFDSLEVSEQGKANVKTLLKMIFDYSIRYDVIPPEKVVIFDYIDISSKISVDKRKRAIWTEYEIERLKIINNDMSKTLLFLIYTGMRPDEFVNITEDWFDEEEMIIHVGKSKTKTGLRDIPLSEKAKKLLPMTQYLNYDQLFYYYKDFAEEYNFDHQMYDCRHTFVSLLTEKGVDLRIIQSLVGHKGDSVTENVYTHISIETKREAINKI